jgi:hypothetical protein
VIEINSSTPCHVKCNDYANQLIVRILKLRSCGFFARVDKKATISRIVASFGVMLFPPKSS